MDDSDLCRPRLSEFHGYMSPWVLKITCIRATMSTACIIILSIYKWHRRTSSTEQAVLAAYLASVRLWVQSREGERAQAII